MKVEEAQSIVKDSVQSILDGIYKKIATAAREGKIKLNDHEIEVKELEIFENVIIPLLKKDGFDCGISRGSSGAHFLTIYWNF